MKSTLCLALFVISLLCPRLATAQKTPPKTENASPIWVCAYYLAGDQASKRLLPEQIDFAAMTHLIHFRVAAESDGSFDPATCGTTVEQARTVVGLAHKAGKKVLLGFATDPDAKKLRVALKDPARPNLVRNLVRLVVDRGYDGVDIDVEPLDDPDVPDYEKFIRELYPALKAAGPNLILTAAVAKQPALFNRLQFAFDRINLMTYDLSGPWPGNRSWYNGCLFDGGKLFGPGDPCPSVDGMVQQFVKAGVAPGKLGIGIAFYGYVWTGVDGPMQNIKGVSVDDSVDYNVIREKYGTRAQYHWDTVAHAPYRSISASEAKDRLFVSYDDERLCAEKIQYTRDHNLGGVIIWELGGAYFPSPKSGPKDPLLQSVKRALHTTGSSAKPKVSATTRP